MPASLSILSIYLSVKASPSCLYVLLSVFAVIAWVMYDVCGGHRGQSYGHIVAEFVPTYAEKLRLGLTDHTAAEHLMDVSESLDASVTYRNWSQIYHHPRIAIPLLSMAHLGMLNLHYHYLRQKKRQTPHCQLHRRSRQRPHRRPHRGSCCKPCQRSFRMSCQEITLKLLWGRATAESRDLLNPRRTP